VQEEAIHAAGLAGRGIIISQFRRIYELLSELRLTYRSWWESPYE